MLSCVIGIELELLFHNSPIMQRKHSSTSMKVLAVKNNMRFAECLLPFFSW